MWNGCKVFRIEDRDEVVLSSEGEIIAKGGFFYAQYNDQIVGTVSLLKVSEFYEVSKMAVTQGVQGLGIGKLLNIVLQLPRKKKLALILYSNRN
jgi:hypothetical protein